MIPDELTQHVSLRGGKGPKHAISFGVRLDSSGKIDRYRIIPSILNNIVNMSYDEMDAIITNDMKRATNLSQEIKTAHYDVLLKLAEFAKQRRALRVDQGAVIIVTPKPDVRVHTDATGNKVVKFGVDTDFSRNAKGVVMEMMLLVGEVSANYFKERGTPVLYRVQPLSQSSSKLAFLLYF